MDAINKAFETISGYCAKTPRCEKCRFSEKEDGTCILQNYVPSDWISEKEKRCKD